MTRSVIKSSETKEKETFCPANRQEWRAWLEQNHAEKRSVWLIYHKKKTGTPSITYNEAVDEALCFGWIDSTRKSLDGNTFTQYFCQRKPGSVWSRINKAKVEQLSKDGLMTPAGYASIETAKRNGSWTILDETEELIIPGDLEKELNLNAGAMEYFLSLTRSVRKVMLQWLVMAKLPETRQKRLKEISELAAKKQKPKQF